MSVTYHVTNNIATIEFDMPDSKVNLLTSDCLLRLGNICDEIKRQPGVKAVVLVSKKKDVFIAGADIKEIDAILLKEVGVEKSKAGQEILNKIEDLPMPTIAVIDGLALGGGCELALSCRYRVATFNEKIKIGLPEVKLGILPGFGGTYRLPRLIGLQESLKMIVSGDPVNAEKAYKIGLFDRLFPQAGLERCVAEFVEEAVVAKKRLPSGARKKKGLDAFLDSTPIGRAIVFREAKRTTLEKTKGFYPSLLNVIDLIQKTLPLKRKAALDAEAMAFSELVVTDISKNLVHVFYLTEKFRKLTLPGVDVQVKPIKKCGVIGAGVMGGGIAQILSDKNITVRLKDINYDALGKGLKAAADIYGQAVKRRKIKKSEAELRMSRISTTLDYSGFQNADCVIEAVVENMDIKKKVFAELGSQVPEHAILCTNTSALSVTEMAKVAKNPGRVIGLHFFNPVNRMPLIEIIHTEMTSPETIAATLELTKRLGKTPIIVKDSSGFLVNRILLGYINEAARIWEEGMPFTAIDRIVTNFGMPMGPFILSDEVGLDVGLKVLHILHENLGDRFKPISAFEKIYQKKLLGKKSGKGFYIHKKGKRPAPNAEVEDTLNGVKKYSVSESEALTRMMYVMINEAARCLEEKIIDDASVVDVGMIMGTGFPPFRGGLLRYADSIGPGKIVNELLQLREKYSADRFRPCRYLMGLKENSKTFYSK